MDRVSGAATRIDEPSERDTTRSSGQAGLTTGERFMAEPTQFDRLLGITTPGERPRQESTDDPLPDTAEKRASLWSSTWPAPAFFGGFSGLGSLSVQQGAVFSGIDLGFPSFSIPNIYWSDSSSNRGMNAALNGTDDALYSRLTVTDQSVSWPDDGDYLVFDHVAQDVVSFGRTSAELQPGVYGVFNVTTGERSDVAVGDVAGGGTRARKEASEDDEDSNIFVGPQPGFTRNDDGSITITVTDGPGHHEITVTPEDDWPETFADAGWGTVGGAVGTSMLIGPSGAVPGAVGGTIVGAGGAVDIEYEWHPPGWMTWLADVLTPEPRPPVSVTVYPESAPASNGAPLGEWGGARDSEGEPVNSLAAAAADDFDAAHSEPADTEEVEEPARTSRPQTQSGGDGWDGHDSDNGASQNSNSDTDGIGP